MLLANLHIVFAVVASIGYHILYLSDLLRVALALHLAPSCQWPVPWLHAWPLSLHIQPHRGHDVLRLVLLSWLWHRGKSFIPNLKLREKSTAKRRYTVMVRVLVGTEITKCNRVMRCTFKLAVRKYACRVTDISTP